MSASCSSAQDKRIQTSRKKQSSILDSCCFCSRQEDTDKQSRVITCVLLEGRLEEAALCPARGKTGGGDGGPERWQGNNNPPAAAPRADGGRPEEAGGETATRRRQLLARIGKRGAEGGGFASGRDSTAAASPGGAGETRASR